MPALLGVDAAWTRQRPSGVALLSGDDGNGWYCVGLAPSYEAFVDLAGGSPVDWGARPIGGPVDVERLLAAARELAASSIEVVAIDMPLSALPITGRRAADRYISRRFGGRGASAHSPSAKRPGPLKLPGFHAACAIPGEVHLHETGGSSNLDCSHVQFKGACCVDERFVVVCFCETYLGPEDASGGERLKRQQVQPQSARQQLGHRPPQFP